MAGANFDRIKNWQEEVLTHDDLNREIDNILEHFNTDGMASYSETLGQMQTQTDPGELGNESLATSLAGEIERLRFVIARILGDAANYWYEPPTRTLSELSDIVDVLSQAAASHRTVSGLTTGNSNQLNALAPHGTEPSVELRASLVPFSYYIKNVLHTVEENVSVSGLLTAPSSDNTATINDPLATNNQNSEFYGQFGSVISIDNAGSEITTRIGQLAAFKNGNEVFVARIKSSTLLTEAFRGCFFDSNLDRIPAETLNDDDTITLLRLTWIFINDSGEFVLTYNTPTTSPVQPSGAAVGDYWYDTVNGEWKSFNSVAWVPLNVTLIGMCVQDETGTIAARTFDQALAVSALNQVKLERLSDSTVGLANTNPLISVAGKLLDLGFNNTIWDMAKHLDAGFSEAIDTWYYFYLTETGQQVISPVAPAFRNNLQGFYHPHELWRCVGYVRNDGGSDFESDVFNLVSVADMPYPPMVGKYPLLGGTTGDTSAFESDSSLLVPITGLETIIHPTGKQLEIGFKEHERTVFTPAGEFTAIEFQENANPTMFMSTLTLQLVRIRLSDNTETEVGQLTTSIGGVMNLKVINAHTNQVEEDYRIDIDDSRTSVLGAGAVKFFDRPPLNEGPVKYELRGKIDGFDAKFSVTRVQMYIREVHGD